MTTEIWVNIGSGNGLLPDGTKPLPEPMLTHYQSKVQRHPSRHSFRRISLTINHWNNFEFFLSKFSFKSPRGQWVNGHPMHHVSANERWCYFVAMSLIGWETLLQSNAIFHWLGANLESALNFVRGVLQSPVNSPHKGQWHGALKFSLICA